MKSVDLILMECLVNVLIYICFIGALTLTENMAVNETPLLPPASLLLAIHVVYNIVISPCG